MTLVRLRGSCALPARFQLVASMNPCPCGRCDEPETRGPRCTPAARRAYRRRISGPILDRFDLHVEVCALEPRELAGPADGEPSAVVRERVLAARARQRGRTSHLAAPTCNALLRGRALRQLALATPEALALLGEAMRRLRLSARAHDRVLKVARTIADLEGEEHVEEAHVHEAIQMRALDRPADPPGPRLPPRWLLPPGIAPAPEAATAALAEPAPEEAAASAPAHEPTPTPAAANEPTPTPVVAPPPAPTTQSPLSGPMAAREEHARSSA